MKEKDIQALIDGTATIPYRITILEDNIVLTEKDIISTTYEDYRYVDTATICIGQFVARTISGTIKYRDDINIEDKEIKVEIGIKNDGEPTYYSLGNFLITKPSDDDVKDVIEFKGMDYTKKFNKKFDDSGIKYPITAIDLAQYCCKQCGVEFAFRMFNNYDFEIENNQYDSDTTYRDVMKDIGKLAYSWVRIGWDNKCYIDFNVDSYSDVKEYNTITTHNYYDLSLQKQKYGPVNRVIIGMSNVEGENVVVEDTASIENNGLCEIKIMDNNLTYTPELREKVKYSAETLFGLEFYPLEINTTGHPWLTGKQAVIINGTNGTQYKTIPFDRTIEYQGHIKTKLTSKADSKVETEYKNTNTLENDVKKTRYIVDKDNQRITQLVENVSQYDSKISTLETSISGIEAKVEEVADLIREVDGREHVTIENAYEGNLVSLSIHGEFIPIFPYNSLYPTNTLYPKKDYCILTIENSENKKEIKLPFTNLLEKDGIYDEFIVEQSGKCYIIKRLSISENNDIIVKEKEDIINLENLEIPIFDGDNTISIDNANLYLDVKYATKNDLSETFATKLELSSSIKLTNESINLKVSKNDLVSEINQSADEIRITGNRFVVEADNLSIDRDGTLSANGVNLSGRLRTYSDNNKLAIDMNGTSLYLYDWYGEQDVKSGGVGSLHNKSTGENGVGMWTENEGDFIALGYKTLDSSTQIKTLMRFDKNSNDPPYVANTASGTLFANNPEGGLIVKNGFIKNWGIKGYTGTCRATLDDVTSVLEVKDGLIVNYYWE